ncbi:MAG: hypothetical protein ACI8Y3_000291 [Paraglaciecola sp.]
MDLVTVTTDELSGNLNQVLLLNETVATELEVQEHTSSSVVMRVKSTSDLASDTEDGFR